MTLFLLQNSLLLTMPEDTLNLTCPTAKDKIEWLTAFQSAIKMSLHINVDVNSRSAPPLARFATYTFTKVPNLKDAVYRGELVPFLSCCCSIGDRLLLFRRLVLRQNTWRGGTPLA